MSTTNANVRAWPLRHASASTGEELGDRLLQEGQNVAHESNLTMNTISVLRDQELSEGKLPDSTCLGTNETHLEHHYHGFTKVTI